MGVRKSTLMRRCNSLVTSIIGCLTIAFFVLNKILTTEPESEDLHLKMTRVGVTTTPSWDLKREKNLDNSDAKYQTHRFVTPSLAEIGGRRSIPEMNDHTLMITRLPGAGSELLVLILQRLQGLNAFKHIRLPPGDENLLTTLQQELLVEDITIIMKREAVPLTFDADLRFLNFSAFGRQAPTFISMARNPLDPKILKRYNGKGVNPTYCGSIAYFCGQDPRCTHENRTWAMMEAQANIERWYPVVGLLEHVEVTLKILEKTFPYFFKGASEVYSKFHVKKRIPNKVKEPKTASGEEKISTEYLAKEVEFYLWLKSRLFHPKSDNG
ncbi:uronyl 2-sulfotransferase-like [Athalia rosae]|uniref:uronyl 2-sulfotransferase-like n=1 Tax=Athalia rosae TaxID=37344 RepID=UPI0020339271|nr:uronyl 2-sulfotransferase-like [Athalia rosae]